MDRPSYQTNIDLLISELGFSLEDEMYRYHAPESPKKEGFRLHPLTTDEIDHGDINTWDQLNQAATAWSVLCAPLDARHATPRLLINLKSEAEALYALPFSFKGDEPRVSYPYQTHSYVLTQLDAEQGLILLSEEGQGLCVGCAERGVVELRLLASPLLSSTEELTRLVEGRAPAWTVHTLSQASTPLARALSLGALTRYLPPLAQEACEPEGEDPARVLLFNLIEELEGWELTSERAGLAELDALHQTLDLLLAKPCEANLSPLILGRERVAQRCAAEALVGFSGPLSEAALRFDQKAEQVLSDHAGDSSLRALPRLKDPSLSAALAARAADWWLLFAER